MEPPLVSDNTRAASVAGRFYPEDPIVLREQVESMLERACCPSGPAPKAIIAPHAGYMYSGLVAAEAYKQFVPDQGVIKRVILLGPSHYEAFAGVALTSAQGFATPLGLVPIDVACTQSLKGLPLVSVRDDAHAPEHSLEVHVPFLQVVLGEFALVPLLCGEIGVPQLSAILERLWGGNETRFVISSDLSHNLKDAAARSVDQSTARAIVSLDFERVGERQACGCVPIRGMLDAARRHHLSARLLLLRNSADAKGPKERVVGYGAFAFEQV